MHIFLRLKVLVLNTAVIELKMTSCLSQELLTFDPGWLHYPIRTLLSVNDLHTQRSAKQFLTCIPNCEGILDLLVTVLLHKPSYRS